MQFKTNFNRHRSICFSLMAFTTLILSAESFAAVLPAGFKITRIAQGVQKPTSVNISPDGRIFVSQKDGNLRIIKKGVLLDEPFLKVDTNSEGELGLIGVAFDPNYLSNAYIYVSYFAKTPYVHNRISRFTANGDKVVPGTEVILFEGDNKGRSRIHGAGGLKFGPDGKLYIGIGENGGLPARDNAQNLTNVFGKVLRINSNGSIPTDNPFYNKLQGKYRAIWAYGLRNPFSFEFQKGTNRMFINDVGEVTWEEINLGKSGGNYGWPYAEGPSTNPNYIAPLFAYLHGPSGDDTKGCSIVGGAFYNPQVQTFPSKYVGKYFFNDYCSNWLHVLDPATGKVSSFGQSITSNPVGLALSKNGNLYYASAWFNSVYELSYSSTEQDNDTEIGEEVILD